MLYTSFLCISRVNFNFNRISSPRTETEDKQFVLFLSLSLSLFLSLDAHILKRIGAWKRVNEELVCMYMYMISFFVFICCLLLFFLSFLLPSCKGVGRYCLPLLFELKHQHKWGYCTPGWGRSGTHLQTRALTGECDISGISSIFVLVHFVSFFLHRSRI